MARPKKNNAEKLTDRLPHIRCTETEAAVIKAQAAQAGLTVSEYARRILTEGQVIVQQSRYDFQTVNQLRRIGVNLNQIAKIANSTGEAPPALLTVCNKLDAVLDDILETF